jgi:type I restriction enzyme S subunit
MSFPRYLSYRDSGVEWLGDLPIHWEVKRLRYLGEAIIGLTYGPADVTDESDEDGVLVLRSSNVQGGRIVFDDNVYVRSNIPERLLTQAEDILICSRNGSRALIGKNAVIDKNVSGLTFGAFMTLFRGKYNDYLRYVFNSPLFTFQSGSFLTSTINQLTVGNLNSFEIPLPPTEDRSAIVAFLDRETAKIDALVEQQQRLIELLKEKRQAVISRAVTKGLNPNAPMKDSGIEWLGEVPEHWTVAPLKRFISVLSGYAFPSDGFSSDPQDTRLLRGVNIGVGSIRWEEVVYWTRREDDRLEDWELRAGDVVLGMDRPWIADGLRLARMSDEDVPCLLLQRVASLRPCEHLLPDYLIYLLEGNAFYHHCVPEMTGVSVPHISPSQIDDFLVAIPPIDEQAKILEHTNKLAADVKHLTEATEKAIDLLRERRAALISAAVTGKIDVRENAPIELAVA